MRITALFFVFFTVFAGSSFAGSIKYCNIGADPVEKGKRLSPGEHFYYLPAGAMVKMKTGSGKTVVCKLKNTEKVSFSKNGVPLWIARCGNPILGVRLARARVKRVQKVRVRLRLEDFEKRALLAGFHPPAIQQVHECGPGTECWARAQQFRANFNVGVGAEWVYYSGLPDYNVSYNQSQNANGGRGGQGGNGGNATANTTSNTSTTAGPVNPNDPPGGGGGPVNPNDPPGGGGPGNPNDPPGGGGGGPVNP